MSLRLPPEVVPDRPVLIAGPTASGKSALALAIAESQGGLVVNADALQVYAGWRILTARPTIAEEARAPHRLYGHVPLGAAYSVGDWLRDLVPLLTSGERPIIVGGTGLYFTALTQGLADIPPTPPAIRAEADRQPLEALILDLPGSVQAGLDLRNRARVQRAWEVARATGRHITDWQAETPPALLPLDQTVPLVLEAEVDWLNQRIAQRFNAMLAGGALDEARAILPQWNPDHLSSKAIGAAELMAHLKGALSLDEARVAAIIASRQYAKRQRTWFRSRMKGWTRVSLPALG